MAHQILSTSYYGCCHDGGIFWLYALSYCANKVFGWGYSVGNTLFEKPEYVYLIGSFAPEIAFYLDENKVRKVEVHSPQESIFEQFISRASA